VKSKYETQEKTVKEVKAYVREHMLDDVLDGLAAIPDMPGIAVVHLRVYGRATDEGGLVRIEVVKLEIDVRDTLVPTVVDTIVAHARTGDGHPGDGRVFVSDLGRAIRIADGEPDHDTGDTGDCDGRT
jgi:Nitrogen regulatory protein PII